jgi:hypothetical protein
MLLLVGAAALWPQNDDAVKDAVAAIQKAEGKVTIATGQPGNPVVAVDL